MNQPTDLMTFSCREEWREWLQRHHAERREAWLVHLKKGAGGSGLGYEEAVEEALCFGWIDGLLRRIDRERFALRYSPRRRNSVWSESNKSRVEKLIRDGRMSQAGLAAVAEARENGQWDAAAQREMTDVIPPDLEDALAQREGALKAYRASTASRKKQIIYWLSSARRPATRVTRVQTIVDQLAGPPGD